MKNPLKAGGQDISVYAELWRTIRSGEAWQGELVNRRKDGTLYVEQTTMAPVQNSAGKVTGSSQSNRM